MKETIWMIKMNNGLRRFKGIGGLPSKKREEIMKKYGLKEYDYTLDQDQDYTEQFLKKRIIALEDRLIELEVDGIENRIAVDELNKRVNDYESIMPNGLIDDLKEKKVKKLNSGENFYLNKNGDVIARVEESK